MADPKWLVWSRELQAIAQSGLTYARDPYDRERYEQARSLASRIMAEHTATPIQRIEALFANEKGYATPKVDVRGAVFDGEQRVLLVRETFDEGRWTLPGGFSDVNLTGAENVVREVREETGYEVRVTKLAASWDRDRQGHPPSAFTFVKQYYLCALTGGESKTSLETSEVAWFRESELPNDLSLGRVLLSQLKRMFDHARTPSLPTDFD